MARDQRTRLNAELAHQYGAGGSKKGDAAPGRSGLPENLEETNEVELADDIEEKVEVIAQPEQAPERDSRKSIFNLPRREPARAPVLPGYSEDTPQETAGASAPAPPDGSRRR